MAGQNHESDGTEESDFFRSSSFGLPRHDIDLDFNSIPEHGLHGGSGRQNGHSFEEFFIHRVIAVEFFDIREMHGGFNDVINRATGCLEYLFDLSEGEQSFFLNRASNR